MTEDSERDPEGTDGHADARSHDVDGGSAAGEGEHTDSDAPRDQSDRPRHPNPPRTTRGWFTAPEFGAAGSGGAEYEQGPETD
jgi:hypothetical protein